MFKCNHEEHLRTLEEGRNYIRSILAKQQNIEPIIRGVFNQFSINIPSYKQFFSSVNKSLEEVCKAFHLLRESKLDLKVQRGFDFMVVSAPDREGQYTNIGNVIFNKHFCISYEEKKRYLFAEAGAVNNSFESGNLYSLETSSRVHLFKEVYPFSLVREKNRMKNQPFLTLASKAKPFSYRILSDTFCLK